MHSRSIAPIASVSGVADHVIRAWDGTAPVVAMVMTHDSHAYIDLSEQSRYQLYNVWCVWRREFEASISLASNTGL